MARRFSAASYIGHNQWIVPHTVGLRRRSSTHARCHVVNDGVHWHRCYSFQKCFGTLMRLQMKRAAFRTYRGLRFGLSRPRRQKDGSCVDLWNTNTR